MKHLLVALLFPCLIACVPERRMSMPELAEIRDMPGIDHCERIFPRGEWQFVHSINFLAGGRGGGNVIGVTGLGEEEINCALMTVEGFTLFQGALREGDKLEVRRAVAPFDNPALAEGLMGDVRRIFQAPHAENIWHGRTESGPVCRYAGGDGRVTDILPAAGDYCWQIITYSADRMMDRSIVGRNCREIGETVIPERIELRGFGQENYTLELILLNAEELNR
jgi:hypothetical protein